MTHYQCIRSMKRLNVLLILFIALGSCSVSKKINRSAVRYILTEKPFETAHTGISIFDPSKDRSLYNYQSDKYFVPASNIKLLTCYVAMKYLDDSLPGIQYQALEDSVVLIKGTGDPTILHPDFSYQPVFHFLKKFKQIQVVPTWFDEYLGNGWSWDDYIYDYAAPRSGMPLYGDVIRVKQNDGGVWVEPSFFLNNVKIKGDIANGLAISRPWSENIFTLVKGKQRNIDVPFIPYDSTLMQLLSDTLHIPVVKAEKTLQNTGFVYTQPLDSMLSIMMHRSDNFFAEQSLLMVSEKLLGVLNDGKIIERLLGTDFAKMPQKPRWVDGSGLSAYNLITPDDFVFVLNQLKNEFGLERLKIILPTGGTGTLSSLYKEEAGKIFAKTGTINGVVSLSGYLITKKNRLLIFSVLVNNHNGPAVEIRKGVESFLKEVIYRN